LRPGARAEVRRAGVIGMSNPPVAMLRIDYRDAPLPPASAARANLTLYFPTCDWESIADDA
jgi:hypothetical protein